MKKLAILMMVLALGGCATMLRPIQNPVNLNELASVESAYGVALSIALAYKSLPLCKRSSPASFTHACANRSIIVKLQNADRNAQIALANARNFVRNNPTLDVSAFIQIARNAVGAFQQIEQNNNLN